MFLIENNQNGSEYAGINYFKDLEKKSNRKIPPKTAQIHKTNIPSKP